MMNRAVAAATAWKPTSTNPAPKKSSGTTGRMGTVTNMKKIDLAYIAGLIDGEAYIGIKKSKPMNGNLNDSYHERIQIRMVDEEAIAFIATNLGGNYYKEKPHADNGRSLYCYQASDKKAAAILELVLPYLRVKRRVAKRVLDLRKKKDKPHKIRVLVNVKNRWGQIRSVRRARLSEQEVSMRSMMYLDCKAINAGKV